jgi:hypothetical protein
MLDVTGPLQMFAGVNDELGRQAYELAIAAPKRVSFKTSSGIGLVADLAIADVSPAKCRASDTLIAAGGDPGLCRALESGEIISSRSAPSRRTSAALQSWLLDRRSPPSRPAGGNQAFARMAVRLGHPIETLISLEVLLDPALVEEVLNAYWDVSEKEEPCVYTIDMAWKLLSVARETNCLSGGDIAKLDDIGAAMEEHRQGGLTEKNLNVIRAVLTGKVWNQVVQLPLALMAEARLLRHQAPVKAAVTAQIATAIAILTFAPIRFGNLIQIKLDENLIKPGALDDPYWLVFPHYDVKNRVRLQFKLVPQLCAIIDEYIHDYRSVLLRGSNATWLFPGETGGVKTSRTLSLQITDRIEKGCGLRMTAHQFQARGCGDFPQGSSRRVRNDPATSGPLSAVIPRLGGAESNEGIEVFGGAEGVHSQARR